MKRRSFIQASIAAATAAGAAPVSGAERQGGSMFELRSYSLKAARLPILEAYLSKALMPALKRFGIGPVGVFVEKGEQEPLKVYVLIVYPAADQVVALSSRLAADDEYLKAGKEYLAALPSDPVYSPPYLREPQRASGQEEDRDVQQGRAGHLSPRWAHTGLLRRDGHRQRDAKPHLPVGVPG